MAVVLAGMDPEVPSVPVAVFVSAAGVPVSHACWWSAWAIRIDPGRRGVVGVDGR